MSDVQKRCAEKILTQVKFTGTVQIPPSSLQHDLKGVFNNPLSSDVQITVEGYEGRHFVLLLLVSLAGKTCLYGFGRLKCCVPLFFFTFFGTFARITRK